MIRYGIVGFRATCGASLDARLNGPIEIEFRRGGSVAEKEIVSNADAYARQVDMFSTAIEGNLEARFAAKKVGRIRRSWMRPMAA